MRTSSRGSTHPRRSCTTQRIQRFCTIQSIQSTSQSKTNRPHPSHPHPSRLRMNRFHRSRQIHRHLPTLRQTEQLRRAIAQFRQASEGVSPLTMFSHCTLLVSHPRPPRHPTIPASCTRRARQEGVFSQYLITASRGRQARHSQDSRHWNHRRCFCRVHPPCLRPTTCLHQTTCLRHHHFRLGHPHRFQTAHRRCGSCLARS